MKDMLKNCRNCMFSKPNDGKVTKEKNVSLCTQNCGWNGTKLEYAVVYDSHKYCCRGYRHY